MYHYYYHYYFNDLEEVIHDLLKICLDYCNSVLYWDSSLVNASARPLMGPESSGVSTSR